jgi:predicted glycogen debranching enzyme
MARDDREWVLTNGLGGYALGFGNMVNKRKYNGLLIASDSSLVRTHILSSLEESISQKGMQFFADANHYPNCIYPQGYTHIVNTWLRPAPCVLYSSAPPNDDCIMTKEIFMSDGKNAVTIKYRNCGKSPFTIELKPKFSLRNSHHVNPSGSFADEASTGFENRHTSFRIWRTGGGPEAFLFISSGEIIPDRAIYSSVYYPLEASRGYDSVEDLISPARIRVTLNPSESFYLLTSTEDLKDAMGETMLAENRYKTLPLPTDHPDKIAPLNFLAAPPAKSVFSLSQKDYLKTLEFACKDFILQNNDLIAGYPWFGAWGRDTLISMSGLSNLEHGPQIAIGILKKYGKDIHEGLIPNMFGEGGIGTNYDTVDAPLWYVLRCREFAKENKELFAKACQIVLCYMNSENHPFHMDTDGLINIRPGNQALTWMDAKIYNEPVTPRWGKPIEINALWYNALSSIIELAKNFKERDIRFGPYKSSIKDISSLAEKVKKSMEAFSGPRYPADRIEQGIPIWEIRPNAVIAMSLPYDFANPAEIERTFEVARDKLLTPYGLRSLSPDHPAFKQKYVGNARQRDLAYHQGTVWAFLMLPFIKLAKKVFSARGKDALFQKEASRYIWHLRNSIMNGEAASIAEIWDGVDPYLPKGCPAQAWSVFALFEAEHISA